MMRLQQECPSPVAPVATSAAEASLYYIQVPAAPHSVKHDVEFWPVQRLLQEEESCRALWDMLTQNFRTRGKFLAIWPHVRYVAVYRPEGKTVGVLLVSAPLNWQIDYVTVHEDRRGQQIASSLVLETVNQAGSLGVPYVMLTSREGLRPLYEGVCGFTVVGQT